MVGFGYVLWLGLVLLFDCVRFLPMIGFGSVTPLGWVGLLPFVGLGRVRFFQGLGYVPNARFGIFPRVVFGDFPTRDFGFVQRRFQCFSQGWVWQVLMAAVICEGRLVFSSFFNVQYN
jgi:hypothetical protein